MDDDDDRMSIMADNLEFLSDDEDGSTTGYHLPNSPGGSVSPTVTTCPHRTRKPFQRGRVRTAAKVKGRPPRARAVLLSGRPVRGKTKPHPHFLKRATMR